MRIGITERGDGGLELGKVLKELKFYDGAIIVTKAPQKLLNVGSGPLGILSGLPSNVVIHCTITGCGSTVIEPNVVDPMVALDAYRELVSAYGGERVVLRVDPILPWQPYYGAAMRVLAQAEGRTRISFLDLYPHVQKRLEDAGIDIPFQRFGLDGDIHTMIPFRNWVYDYIVKVLKIEPEICGEPGMPCTGCVSKRDLDAMGLTYESRGTSGQRRSCACMAEKTEMLSTRGQCAHKCLYCYWK